MALSNLSEEIQKILLSWMSLHGSNQLLLLCALQFVPVSMTPYCLIPGPLHSCAPSAWPLYACELKTLLSFYLSGRIMYSLQQCYYDSNICFDSFQNQVESHIKEMGWVV